MTDKFLKVNLSQRHMAALYMFLLLEPPPPNKQFYYCLLCQSILASVTLFSKLSYCSNVVFCSNLQLEFHLQTGKF